MSTVQAKQSVSKQALVRLEELKKQYGDARVSFAYARHRMSYNIVESVRRTEQEVV